MKKSNKNPVNSRSRLIEKDVRLAFEAFTERVAADVLRRLADAPPEPGIGIDPVKSQERLRQWLSLLAGSANEAGRQASLAAFHELLLNGNVMRHFADATRSQAGRKGEASRTQKNGGKPRIWLIGLRLILRNKRFMNRVKTTSDIIARLVNDCILDEEIDGSFICHVTAEPVAKSRKNLVSAISRAKNKLAE